MELSITQPFFELDNQDFAWKIVWMIHSGITRAGALVATPLIVSCLILLYYCHLFGQSIQTSMQNLESVAPKMAELLLDAPETPSFHAPDQKKSHNLLRQFIPSSMQNMESVAQKMAELPFDTYP